ncbi:MAG: chemotaxis protein CheX [Deltaproteobacteria bacterium]|nr:chemotaxis protein CheX [Deltaproteobacteria bacterium]
MATNLKSENKDGILFIYCAGDLGAAFVSDAIPLVQKEPPDSYRAVGLELLACADITDSNAFRTIAVLAKTLKSQDKKLFALYANSKVASAIRDHGLDLAVPLLDSEDFIPQILAKPPPPVTKIDVEFINPFINGAIMTLDMQCTLKATPGKPFLKGSGPVEVVTEIAGIIGLVSPHFNGSIAICFPKELFLSIMSTMLGEKFDTITKDLDDGPPHDAESHHRAAVHDAVRRVSDRDRHRSGRDDPVAPDTRKILPIQSRLFPDEKPS